MEKQSANSGLTSLQFNIIPLLRWDLRFLGQESALVLLLEDAEYRFGGIEKDAAQAILSLVDGRRTVSEIADKTSLPAAQVEEFIKKLIAFGLAADMSAQGEAVLSREKFTATCRRFFPVWKDRLFSHHLWRLLTSGQASSSLFLGWLLESFHFIEGVNDRLALAVAECPTPQARHVFARHFTEEYNHSEFFLKALSAMGVSPAVAHRSRPLPGTLAVLHHMRRCARRDSLQYAVCSGFLESTGADRLKARQFFEYLSQNNPSRPPGAVTPLQAHLNLDEDYGHNGLLESVCGHLGEISQRRASSALLAGHGLVEALELWSTDILRTYQRAGSAPRLGLYGYRSPHEQPLPLTGEMN